MDTSIWVTVVAHDTPFLAQLAVERLEEAQIEHRTLSDSGGGNLPHISFGSGGYRVQVPADREQAAREALAALPEGALDHLDVGAFDDTHDGVRPPSHSARAPWDEGPTTSGSRRSWVRVGALVTAVVVVVAFFVSAWPLEIAG